MIVLTGTIIDGFSRCSTLIGFWRLKFKVLVIDRDSFIRSIITLGPIILNGLGSSFGIILENGIGDFGL